MSVSIHCVMGDHGDCRANSCGCSCHGRERRIQRNETTEVGRRAWAAVDAAAARAPVDPHPGDPGARRLGDFGSIMPYRPSEKKDDSSNPS